MQNLFETVALLPMKANSERVKGKNFKNFCGKPLFKWMLDKLLLIPSIDKIVINTDAIDILKSYDCFKNEKIIIRQRPQHICGDLVSMNDVIKNDLDNIQAKTYLMTHTTNPLLTEQSITNSIIRYKNGLGSGFDSLFTANKIQSRFYDEDCKPLNHDPKNLIRTQDLKPWFEENSNLYIFSKKSFESTNARIGKNPQMMITQSFESTDIDTPSDWELAEVLVKYYREKGILI
jgi:CMP-N-acetylneuraminic acid synthetase